MTCREFVDFLLAYLEGGLQGPQRAVFDQHMAACPSCVTYLDTYRDTIRLGELCRDDPEGPVPSEVPEELVQAILSARSSDNA